MAGKVQGIGEQAGDVFAAELTRRQADVVHNQQRDRSTFRTLVAIGRRDLHSPGEHAVLVKGTEIHSPNSQPLHAVAQRPESNSKELRRRGAVEASLLESLQDGRPLDAVQVVQ